MQLNTGVARKPKFGGDTNMVISDEGVALVKKFEGLHKVHKDGLVHSYRCPAGKYTIGFGATKGVRSGQTMTKQEAETRLIHDLNEHGKIVKKYVHVPLTQNQYDSLTSFVFNLGVSLLITFTFDILPTTFAISPDVLVKLARL